MKIKIVEPYDLNRRYDFRSLTLNLGPVVIASLLKQQGHEVEVLSEYITKFNFEDINDADIIGISIATYNAKKGFKIARRIEKPVVFGGYHATLMPVECLKYGDFVIRGDGHSIVDLVDYLNNKRTVDVNQIPNLVYKKNGRIFYNHTETKAVNIVPDFSLVRNYYKQNLNRFLRIPLIVNASRGCRHACIFCSIIEAYEDFKGKDIEVVIEDIRSQTSNQHLLSRFLPKLIWITDDNFTSDMRWAKNLLRAMAKLNTGYEFAIQARVDIAYDDELLELMSKAYVGRVAMGIESLDQTSLDNFNKGSTLEDIDYAVKKIASYGIDVFPLFVFGGDTFKKGDGLKIAEFVKQFDLPAALIQPLTPFPGTKLFKKLKEEGRILNEDWQDYNGKVIFSPKNMTPAELQAEIYSCYRNLYSPLNVIKYLISGRKGFKLQFLGEAMFRHLEWFGSRRYIRDKLSKYDMHSANK